MEVKDVQCILFFMRYEIERHPRSVIQDISGILKRFEMPMELLLTLQLARISKSLATKISKI